MLKLRFLNVKNVNQTVCNVFALTFIAGNKWTLFLITRCIFLVLAFWSTLAHNLHLAPNHTFSETSQEFSFAQINVFSEVEKCTVSILTDIKAQLFSESEGRVNLRGYKIYVA